MLASRVALGVAIAMTSLNVRYAKADENAFTAKSSASAGCAANSWSPEVYTFYGDGATIIKKLANFDMDLPERRIYAVLVESDQGAKFAAFEASDDKRVTVSRWEGKSAADLKQQLEKAILENKGVHCVGEQSKAVWSQQFAKDLKTDKEAAPAPVNAKAAFSHMIQDAQDGFIRVTVYLLC